MRARLVVLADSIDHGLLREVLGAKKVPCFVPCGDIAPVRLGRPPPQRLVSLAEERDAVNRAPWHSHRATSHLVDPHALADATPVCAVVNGLVGVHRSRARAASVAHERACGGGG